MRVMCDLASDCPVRLCTGELFIIIIIVIISQTETLTGKHSAIYPRAPAGKTIRYGKGKIVKRTENTSKKIN